MKPEDNETRLKTLQGKGEETHEVYAAWQKNEVMACGTLQACSLTVSYSDSLKV